MSELELQLQLSLLLVMVDDCIKDLGTASLVDGRSARDKLLDIRSFITGMVKEPEVEDVVHTL